MQTEILQAHKIINQYNEAFTHYKFTKNIKHHAAIIDNKNYCISYKGIIMHNIQPIRYIEPEIIRKSLHELIRKSPLLTQHINYQGVSKTLKTLYSNPLTVTNDYREITYLRELFENKVYGFNMIAGKEMTGDTRFLLKKMKYKINESSLSSPLYYNNVNKESYILFIPPMVSHYPHSTLITNNVSIDNIINMGESRVRNFLSSFGRDYRNYVNKYPFDSNAYGRWATEHNFYQNWRNIKNFTL